MYTKTLFFSTNCVAYVVNDTCINDIYTPTEPLKI